jgi:3-hydroxyisobutyrate dehydrogenase
MGMTQQVAFLGTGIMGSRMAMNLLRAGYPLAVWNRSPAKTGLRRPRGPVCLHHVGR